MWTWSRRVPEALLLGLAAALAPAERLAACGFGFPNCILLEDGKDWSRMPGLDFALEIEQILGKDFRLEIPVDLRLGRGDPQAETASAEIEDLRDALAAQGLSEEARKSIVAEVSAFRDRLRATDGRVDTWKPRAASSDQGPDDLAPPPGLPGEFDDYFRGALAYHRVERHQGSFDDARRFWGALLARPADERRYRSVWAAFMIGKTWLSSDPAKAISWFQKTRELAAGGALDRLHLAAASLGWEAKAETLRGDPAKALRLYLDQVRCGQWDAYPSLRFISAHILRGGGADLAKAAADPDARRVVTAYLLSGAGRFLQYESEDRPGTDAWLDAIARAKADDLPGADRLAWFSYDRGDVKRAEKWLALAPRDSAVALWVRARIALRAGDTAEAARLLARVVRALPMEHKWHSLPVDNFHQMDYHSGAGRALGELGAVRLSRRQFVEALDALLRAGYWVDAAYVAERVLTLEELKTYVDREWSTAAPPGLEIGLHSWTNVVDPNRGFALRHLLARRLARSGRWKEARPCFPPSLQGVLDEYVKALQGGKDSRRSAEDRAESLWTAATIARRSGMELLGTELDPDWALHGGDFDPKPFGQSRGDRAPDDSLQVSREEQSRVESSAVEPVKRFHYRYIAGQHALAAVELLPEESEQAAKWLCIAGSWIEKRDPKAADRFYKMLVKRCGKTELGKEAARLRWFPRLDGAKGAGGAGKAGEPPGAEGGTPVPAAGKVGQEGARPEGDAGAPRATLPDS